MELLYSSCGCCCTGSGAMVLAATATDGLTGYGDVLGFALRVRVLLALEAGTETTGTAELTDADDGEDEELIM